MVRLPVGETDFSPLWSVQTVSISHSASYIVRTRESFLGVELSGRESDYLSPTNLGVKNEWGYSSTSPIYLHSVHRENFNFAFVRASQFLICDSWFHLRHLHFFVTSATTKFEEAIVGRFVPKSGHSTLSRIKVSCSRQATCCPWFPVLEMVGAESCYTTLC